MKKIKNNLDLDSIKITLYDYKLGCLMLSKFIKKPSDFKKILAARLIRWLINNGYNNQTISGNKFLIIAYGTNEKTGEKIEIRKNSITYK